jgi:Protein of unknown function (DUF2808)
MKTLSVIMACGISFGGLLMATSSTSAVNGVGNSIHIDQNRQFPTTRWADADHYLRVHVPHNSAGVSALLFQVPGNLRFDASQVEVFDLQGQKIPGLVTEEINSQVSPPSRTIHLDFSTPIASGSQVDLRIRNVKKSRFLGLPPTLYQLN